MKSKSKKMSRSTLAIIIMAFVMVAMVAFGATYAYFTATAKANSATVTTGTVSLAATYSGDSWGKSDTIVFPTQYIIGSAANSDSNPAMKVNVKTNDSKGNYVAVQFAFTVNGKAYSELTEDQKAVFNLNLGENWLAVTGTTIQDNVYLYSTDTTTPAKVTSNLVDGVDVVVIGEGVKFEADDNMTQTQDGVHATQSDKQLMGATIVITVTAKSVQVTGLESATNEEIVATMFKKS